jgi:hypothetical protein
VARSRLRRRSSIGSWLRSLSSEGPLQPSLAETGAVRLVATAADLGGVDDAEQARGRWVRRLYLDEPDPPRDHLDADSAGWGAAVERTGTTREAIKRAVHDAPRRAPASAGAERLGGVDGPVRGIRQDRRAGRLASSWEIEMPRPCGRGRGEHRDHGCADRNGTRPPSGSRAHLAPHQRSVGRWGGRGEEIRQLRGNRQLLITANHQLTMDRRAAGDERRGIPK